MKQWIRWPGLIAFLIITAGLLAFFLLFVDGMVKRLIEKTGSAWVGARVELGQADVSFFPLGLRLTRLQVTDPDQPMANAVEISRIAFTMDMLSLLRRKVIIEEMAVDGVQLNTPRKTSGAISRKHEGHLERGVKSLVEKLPLPSLEVPNIEEILKKEDLAAVKQVQSLREQIEKEQEKRQKQLAELPDQAKLEEYRNRIQKLTSGKKGGLEGILGGAADLIALQKDLKRDLDRINAAKTDLKADLRALQKGIHETAQAPLEDVRRLKEKYSMSPQGLSNISRLLLGPEVGAWVETSLRWNERLKPVLARAVERRKEASVTRPVRGKGLDVHFKEKNPVPEFLIRVAQVSVEIPAGVLTGQVKNITPDQDVMGTPLTFSFSGEKMKDLQRIRLTGELNRVNPAQPKDQLRLQIDGYRVQDLTLAKSQDFPITLNNGRADLEASAVVLNEALDAKILAGIKSAEIKAGPPDGAKPLFKVLASALSDVQGFNFKAEISGTVTDYDLNLTSDLDRVLAQAVGKQVKEQAAQFEAKLRSAVTEKVDKELADLRTQLGGLEGVLDELTSRLKIGDGLLKELIQGGKGGLKIPF